MYATIQLSPYVQIQGLVTRMLPCGSVVISVRERDYIGRPLSCFAPVLRAIS